MLPPTWNRPPCTNIDVKTGSACAARVRAQAERGLVEEHEHAGGDERDRHERHRAAGDVVLERQHQRAGARMTTVGPASQRAAAAATSSAPTASRARPYPSGQSQPTPMTSKNAR